MMLTKSPGSPFNLLKPQNQSYFGRISDLFFHVLTQHCKASKARLSYQSPVGDQHDLSLTMFRDGFFSIKDVYYSSDEFELEFPSSSLAIKVPSRAKLGHFNFSAETELIILTICLSKNCKFFNYNQVSQFCSNNMIIYLNLLAQKVLNNIIQLHNLVIFNIILI